MTKVKKFLFDLDFKDKKVEKEVINETQPSLDPDQIPQFSKIELHEAEKVHENIGYEKGFNEGKNKSLEHTNNQLLKTIEKLSSNLNEYEKNYEIRIKDITENSIKLSFEIAKKLSSSFVNTYPEIEISSTIQQILVEYKKAIHKEKIKIFVNNELIEPLNAIIKENKNNILSSSNYEILGEDQVNKSDFRIEWPSGGIERQFNIIEKEINVKIENFISLLEKELDKKIKEKNNNHETNEINENTEDNSDAKKDTISKIENDNKTDEEEIKNVGGSKTIKYD